MKFYSGKRGSRGADVWVTSDPPGKFGKSYHLPLRLDLRNHSPTGFEWGYGGSGPAQLALALCADAVGDERALDVYQYFKFRVVATLSDAWEMDDHTILKMVREIEEAA